ncbi:MAG: sulfatase-like hydrolase/transferase [Acidobacteriia bacterium]|nr:sulfatase-like hydrolase/transferase [Terriglobia bacterium]
MKRSVAQGRFLWAVVSAAIMVSPLVGGPAGSPPQSLVLITLDTTRADHLGCYGDLNAATPRLDRLAAEGALAMRAVATAPLTLPSHASILTSLYPPSHGVRDNADFRLPDRETTIAVHLKSRGYRTAAVIGSGVLAATQGLARGFDLYDEPRAKPVATAGLLYDVAAERTAAEVSDAAIAALPRLAPGPFFLWVHYFDPHVEYRPPSPFRERFATSPYDGEIAYMDAEIGRLIDAMESRGLLARAVVAVVGDHGESLGEHGERTHGLLLYEGTLRVPLIVRYPGTVRAGLKLRGVVSGVDLSPTLLDLMGMPALPRAQGRSFAPALRGGAEAERGPVYSESLYGERAYGWAPLYALREGARKYVEAPEPEIYDLASDPGEARNLAVEAPGDVAAFRDRLAALTSDLRPAAEGAAQVMGEEQRARLLSLGYVSGGSPAAGRKDRPDPKRLIAQNDAFLEARSLVSAGRLEEARRRLAEVLAADPGNPLALATMGGVLRALGRPAEGLARLEAAAKAGPGVYEIQRNLGSALRDARRPADAAAAYRAAIEIHPSSADAHFGLGEAMNEQGDAAGAVVQYRHALALGLETPAVKAALGLALAVTGDLAGSEKELLLSEGADVAVRAQGWARLGHAAAQKNLFPEARRFLDRALALEPDEPDALLDRAKIRRRQEDLVGAASDLETLAAAKPEHPSARLLWAQALLALGERDAAARAARDFLTQPGADSRLFGIARALIRRVGKS